MDCGGAGVASQYATGGQPQLVEFLQLPDGWPGARATAKHLSQIARAHSTHPLVRGLADSLTRLALVPNAWRIAAAFPGEFAGSRPRVLQEWIATRTRYQDDPPTNEEVTDPGVLLEDALTRRPPLVLGDCDDIAGLTGALALAMRLRARFVLAQFVGQDSPTHIWAEIAEPGGRDWLTCDPTRPSPVPPIARLRAVEV